MKHLIRFSLVLAMLALLMVPATAYAQVTTYETGFQLQNLDTATDASVTIRFLDQNGVQQLASQSTITKGSSKTFFPLDVASGFNGSAVIESNTQVAAITNVLGNGGKYGAAYNGFSGGAGTVNLPLIMKNNFGINTWFNVQNTGSADAMVLVSYKGQNTTCTETATIKPGAAKTFKQDANTCLATGTASFVGAATITNQSGQSPVSVVATVFQVSSDFGPVKAALLAYNGFTTTSKKPIMPLVSSGWYKSGTGIQVQNTSTTTDSDITISYMPSAGFPGHSCTETKTVAKNSSVTFGYPNMPATCYTDAGDGRNTSAFVGSGQVTTNSANVDLVAIANSVTAGTATSDAYDAVDPASATNKVSLPLIMDRNFKIFTGFSIANVGTQPTSIECTFTGTSYKASATNVAPGAALTDVQLGKIANGYVGSATCTATGGDAKIAGIVNELTSGAAASTDALLIYSGINY